MSPKIQLGQVSKAYETPQGPLLAVEDVTLAVEEGEFFALLGPSGCGKSTLLRLIARLLRPTAGEITIRRSTGATRPQTALVFQEYALFPWRSVLDNIAFGLEMRRVPRGAREQVARELVRRMGLQGFEDRYPHQLSGGMRQRVGIARALAQDPEVLLMDEPFAAVDAQTRTVLQEELLRIWEEDKKTVVYVTHSIEEAIYLGDRIALMSVRPRRVKEVFEVGLPRPRKLEMRGWPHFSALALKIWASLRDEVERGMRGGESAP
ncbi:MAG: ABC transporter ATP-binding protein [Deltaproteobacteria bacterium]|nr:ABC transporter ATP-binding protein [Deltaproteobacteria bacterium]MBI3076797.1 ABC transporter ATP-binding protein [Deltaproteobacteria bacterium]